MHDCAKILGITREDYHGLESGKTPLSLPQFELLALYLGVEPSVILDNQQHLPNSSQLNEEIRPRYVNLREKMIQAVLASARHNKQVSFDDIEAATRIPLDILQAYDAGDIPIPLSDILVLSEFLSLSMNTILEPVWERPVDSEDVNEITEWQPEFIDSLQEPTTSDDIYQDILIAYKRLSLKDQAKIARKILKLLRTE